MRAAILVVLAGLLVCLSAHAQMPAVPTDWWLIDQTLDAKTFEVKSEKRVEEFVRWNDCIRAQAGRTSRASGGVVHMFICRHYNGETTT